MRLIRLLLRLRGLLARSWWLSGCLYWFHRLPLDWPARRGGLVLRLWRQHARQRLSRMAWHAPARLAARSGARLPPALQS